MLRLSLSFLSNVAVPVRQHRTHSKDVFNAVPLVHSCQALIAEVVGSYDTMDLFRHTTEISTHVRLRFNSHSVGVHLVVRGRIRCFQGLPF